MAIIRGKGCSFEVEVASTLTEIAQVISIDLPEASAETFEADTLSNTNPGIPKKATGRVDGGSIGLEGFLDPVLSSFQILTDLLNTPVLASTGDGFAIEFSDAADTNWAGIIAGLSLGGTVALNDGVKFNCTIEIDGSISYPT